jgi:hypothetical protein
MQSTARSLVPTIALLVSLSPNLATADPISPMPPDPGAPIPPTVINRTVMITESASEGIGRLFYQALNDPQPTEVMPVNGTFTLPFALQPGNLTCCDLPDDSGSDNIGFGVGPNNTTLINLVSDIPSGERLPVADPGETEKVVANDHVDPVPHTTTFQITSPAEPANVPEPMSLVPFAAGVAVLGILRRRGTRRARPSLLS